MSDGWEILDGNVAEKTAAFGGNPLKTHRVYGTDKRDLARNMKDFDARLELVNAPVVELKEEEDLEAEDEEVVDAEEVPAETEEAPAEEPAEVTEPAADDATEEDGA